MKKFILLLAFLCYIQIVTAQNVGIGTTTPAAKLDVKSPSALTARFNGPNQTYIGIYENDIYRGYFGSHSGNPEDVDFGTGAGTTGKLHLTSKAIPRLTINDLGNVGIGTENPSFKTHITGGDLFIATGFGSLKLGYEGSNQWSFPTTGGGSDLMFRNSPDGVTFTTRHIFTQNGDVGMGTGNSAPAARLDIKTASSISSTSAMMIRNSNNDTLIRVRDNGHVGIGYNGASYGRPLNIEGSGINLYHNATTLGGAIFPDANNNLVLWSGISGPGQNVVLQPGWGQVTIGTYTPAAGYKLSVKGKAITEEVKVQLNGSWPDYVFDEQYKLMPLDELKTNLAINKHLPNIPSSAEVTAANGFELGDMNRRLLEKIEELTLYIIELNEKNQQLQKVNDQTEIRLQKLEKAIL